MKSGCSGPTRRGVVVVNDRVSIPGADWCCRRQIKERLVRSCNMLMVCDDELKCLSRSKGG